MMMYINALKLWWNRTQPPIRRKRTPKPSPDLPCYWCCLCIAVGFPFFEWLRPLSLQIHYSVSATNVFAYISRSEVYIQHAWLGSAACIGYVLFGYVCACVHVYVTKEGKRKRETSRTRCCYLYCCCCCCYCLCIILVHSFCTTKDSMLPHIVAY